jgi:hypothetical protein
VKVHRGSRFTWRGAEVDGAGRIASDMGYKMLGMAVWKGGLWYVRRQHGGRVLPRRGLVIAGAVGAAVAAGYAVSRR